MSKIRVGVVRGGPSSEYVVSLKTGENILRNLDREKYLPVDVLISREGKWYMNGIRADFSSVAHHVDVIWNAMHGSFGEDGKAQRLFELFNVPYTGSGTLSSAIGMHKGLSKERFREAALLVPKGEVVHSQEVPEDALIEIMEKMGFPLIVKPIAGGSSVATRIVRTFEELVNAVVEARLHGDVLVEEVIEGKEATVCVIDSKSANEHFVLFPMEIVPPEKNSFYDYDAKYGGKSQMICPGNFPLTTHNELRNLAIRAHQAIGARHYSRSDFIISPKGIYALEINTLPGLSVLFPRALKASGVEFSEFLDHVIELALSGK